MNDSILGLDLATRRYRDIGIGILQEESGQINCQFLRPGDHQLVDPPGVEALAEYVAKIADAYQVRVIAIDGPQAWKAPDNGLEHQRASEKALRTQAKTGLFGLCKPQSSLRFVRFAIDFYMALEERGWPRQENATATSEKCVIEVFPTAAWRALGVKALPAKPACSNEMVAQWLSQLLARFPLRLEQTPTHDELQALMAGLVGWAFAQQRGYQSYGLMPQRVDGHWQEGFIVNLDGSTLKW